MSLHRIFILLALYTFFIFQTEGQTVSIPPPSTAEHSSFDSLMMFRDRETALIPLKTIDSMIIVEAISEKEGLSPKFIRIVAVGDVMPGTNFPDEKYLPPSCSELFDPVRGIISSADIAIANLEGVFSSNGGSPKNCNDPKTCYVFRMPDSYAECIRDAGFDILGVANNHVNDFGWEGRMNTAKRLDEAGIPFAGFIDRPSVIYEFNGIRIGFCAFAPHIGTLDLKDYKGAYKLVKELKSVTDIVIVYFHGGAEGKDHQNVRNEDEVYLGHNRGNIVKFAHTVVDAGADLVIGNGPHVVRSVENYKEKLIAYSLGNFCTYRRFNLSGPNAIAPILEVSLDENGKFLSGKVHSFIQLGEGGPVPDENKSAAKKIHDLSIMDFPGQELKISKEGEIYFKLDK